MNRRGKQDIEQDLLRRVAALGARAPDRGREDEDELLAELVDGTRSLDDADPATLARLLERDGTELVAELLANPPREEDAGRRGLHLVPPTPLPAPLRMAAAAVGMVGAGLLAFVLSQGSAGPGAGWLRSADLGVTGRPYSASGTLGDERTRWDGELRGALDAELLPRLVVVATSEDAPFGCGAQLEDGWIVTASSVVETAVRAASWSGEAARVGVWITADAAAPLAAARSATVWRHQPERGLSLLRLDGGGDADLAPLPVVEPADGAEVRWLVASPSLDAPVDAAATWSVGATEERTLWARQRVGEHSLRPLAQDIEDGAPGSPVIVDGEEGPALAGILVDARGERGRVVGAADLRELLDAPADDPELRPVDPWSLSPDEEMFRVRAPERASEWIGRVDSRTDPRVVVFLAAAEPAASALPRDGFAPDADGATFPVELFVLLASDDRLAIGVCDGAGRVTRIWGGASSDAMARWTWSRDADGSWRHETSTRGIPFVNPAWLDRGQMRWLEEALGR